MSAKAKKIILRFESIHKKWGKVKRNINFSHKDILVYI